MGVWGGTPTLAFAGGGALWRNQSPKACPFGGPNPREGKNAEPRSRRRAASSVWRRKARARKFLGEGERLLGRDGKNSRRLKGYQKARRFDPRALASALLKSAARRRASARKIFASAHKKGPPRLARRAKTNFCFFFQKLLYSFLRAPVNFSRLPRRRDGPTVFWRAAPALRGAQLAWEFGVLTPTLARGRRA